MLLIDFAPGTAAQREGTVVIASGGAPSRQLRPITDAFQKKFGIKVEMTTGSGNATVSRVLAERKAGRYTVDVGLISLRASNQRLVPSGSLVPFAPLLIHPEVVDTSGWYQGRHWYGDKESKYIFIYHVEQETQYEVWYNTDKIKEAEIATLKKQTDYFDPRWKLIDLWNNMYVVGSAMLGAPTSLRTRHPEMFEAVLVLTLVSAACLIYLIRRIRAVEVVS